MESQDIIELGSSDDDAEPPAPKKIKPSPNAMVHIQKKLQGISIKPMASNISDKNQGVSVKSLSVTRLANSTPSKLKVSSPNNISNGRCVQKHTFKPLCRKIVNGKPVPIKNKLNINPMNVIAHNPDLLNRTASKSLKKHEANVLQQRVLTKLPPSITITRTHSAGRKVENICALKLNKVRVNKELAITPSTNAKGKKKTDEILTVELDDDENLQSSSAKGSLQWYLRPEEQLDSSKLEEKNNMEPAPHKMIEITIEDSPVKLSLLKETFNVNKKDLFITIEDSPKKPINEVISEGSCTEKESNKSPRSKKKLNYTENEQCESIETTAIEIDGDVNKINEEKSENEKLEIQDDCANQQVSQSNEKDNTTNNHIETLGHDMNYYEKCIHNNDHIDGNMGVSDNKGCDMSSDEFHPIVQKFINLCCEIDKTDDMQKIIERRIKNYYRQVSKEYVESEEFLDLVTTKTLMTEADPTKMYLYLKDVVDELNLQRKMAKTGHSAKEQNSREEDADGDCTKNNSKRQRQIHKLEKTIKKLNRAIMKLEEQEVDFDDEEDSVYLLTERYKERLIRVYEKYCKLSNSKMPSESGIQIQSRPGQPPGPSKRLEKLINKKVPIGTPLPFPDFHDVLRCVREASEEDKLGWNEADIMDEARDLFTTCGRKLQRRRQENDWRLAVSRITHSVDPAETNELLKKKLDENKMVADRKVAEIFNRYAERQKQLHLEATEIGDKEADESPEESEDEEVDNSNSLDDRQKRKDRLRRLLEEKSKKLTEEKEISSSTEIKKVSLVDSLSSENKEIKENNESENIYDLDTVQCKQKEIKDKVLEITKSELLKGTVNKGNVFKAENERHNDLKESNSHNEESVIKTKDYITQEETDKTHMKAGGTKTKPQIDGDVYLISDDTDGDELNLLQKLHSENEISSDSSDYDETAIAVSDTDSNSESEVISTCDVISIENSSYSESEQTENVASEDINKTKCSTYKNEGMCNTTGKVGNINVEDTPVDEEMKNDYDENLLLASSEDEEMNSVSFEKECINLKDDDISFGETLIAQDANYNIEMNVSSGNKSSNGYINLNDDEITISETFIGQIKTVESLNKAVGITSVSCKEKDDNEECNKKSNSYETSVSESRNENITNKIIDINNSCRSSDKFNDKDTLTNSICSNNDIISSKEMIIKILTDNNSNIDENDINMERSNCDIPKANDVNVCDKHSHTLEGNHNVNEVKRNTAGIDYTQSSPKKVADNNLSDIKTAAVMASKSYGVYINSNNVIPTSQCIPPETPTGIVAGSKSIEMMLEEMFNSNDS